MKKLVISNLSVTLWIRGGFGLNREKYFEENPGASEVLAINFGMDNEE
ncbi:hypothetical protein [Planococcus beijingensis]|nr:hypothetical protein [Planococcus beijingensis]